jgi:iron-sulfur cluster repair protein YtfE (RIC family)
MSLDEVTFKAFCDKCEKEIVGDTINVFCDDCCGSMKNKEEEKQSAVLFSALTNIENEIPDFKCFTMDSIKRAFEKIRQIIIDSRLVTGKPEMLDELVAVSHDFAREHADQKKQLASAVEELQELRQITRGIKKKIEKAKGDGRETVQVSMLESAFNISE